MTDRKGGSATFWLAGLVLLVTAAGLFYAFGPRPEPDRVTVKHILIAFQGADRASATRTRADAEKLAHETFDRIRNGEDFDKFMKALSDDPGGGTYSMRNRGVTADNPPEEYDRDSMVRSFGDVGFKLKVGEEKLIPYDPKFSLFGWHILKRIR